MRRSTTTAQFRVVEYHRMKVRRYLRNLVYLTSKVPSYIRFVCVYMGWHILKLLYTLIRIGLQQKAPFTGKNILSGLFGRYFHLTSC